MTSPTNTIWISFSQNAEVEKGVVQGNALAFAQVQAQIGGEENTQLQSAEIWQNNKIDVDIDIHSLKHIMPV